MKSRAQTDGYRYSCTALVMLCLSLGPMSAAAQAISREALSDLENPVKAAFLTRFGLFVQWPSSAFSSASSPFVLCVVGEDLFGKSLDEVAGGQQIESHPIVVRRMKTISSSSGCHVAYLGGSPTQRPERMAKALRGSHVLTVSDVSTGGSASGIVHFVNRGNQVRFEIDDEAAARNGLTISSKLLGLALNVKPRNL